MLNPRSPRLKDRNPGWGVNLTSTLSTNTLFEAKYAGWWAYEDYLSTTGSLEEPFYDFTPPGGGQTTYCGGIGAYQGNTWVYNTWRNQFNAKVTHYTDDFMGAQHDFRFGVQFSRGVAFTPGTAIGPTGSYMYHYAPYYYRVTQDPYQYGGISQDVGLFFDDSITLSDRLTINAGIRFDHNNGWVPDYERLTIGDNTDFNHRGVLPAHRRDRLRARHQQLEQHLASDRLCLPARQGGTLGHPRVVRRLLRPERDRELGCPGARRACQALLHRHQPERALRALQRGQHVEPRVRPRSRGTRAVQYAAGFERQIGTSVSVGAEYISQRHRRTSSDGKPWAVSGSLSPSSIRSPERPTTLLSQVQIPPAAERERPRRLARDPRTSTTSRPTTE